MNGEKLKTRNNTDSLIINKILHDNKTELEMTFNQVIINDP